MALGFLCFAVGLRINTTQSIPIGLYRITDAPVAKGEYVIFCPPQSVLFDEARARADTSERVSVRAATDS